MRDPTKPYRTGDLYLAAYFRVAGVPMKGVDRVKEKFIGRDGKEREREKVIFLFEDQGAAVMRQLKDQFYADISEVKALSYAQAIKALKQIIFNGRR